MRIPGYILILCTCSLLPLLNQGCGAKKNSDGNSNDAANYKQNSIDAGRMYVEREAQLIDAYVERSGNDFKSTGTGLRHRIYSEGSGEPAAENDIVEIKFYVNLLDGTPCYNSDSLGTLKFKLGYKDIPSGVSEALLLLRKGDRADLILPSHLAYGLTGDQHKIPGNATLIYKLQVLDLQKN